MGRGEEMKTSPLPNQLDGPFYERAVSYLHVGLADLEEQKHLCREAEALYNRVNMTFTRFQRTRALEDALRCARVRG